MTETTARSAPEGDRLPVALLLDDQDSGRFDAERPAVRGLLALSPAAWSTLSPESRDLLVDDPVTDRAHARITARARRAARQFTAALGPAEAATQAIRPGTRHAVCCMVQQLSFTLARIWEVVRGSGDGPWLIPSDSGWTRCESTGEAQVTLLRHVLSRKSLLDTRPKSNAPVRLLRRLVVRLLRNRGPWVLTTRQRLIYGLDRKIRTGERPQRIFALEPRGSGIYDYLHLWQSLRDGLSGKPTMKLPLSVAPKPGADAPVRRALAAITDPVIRRGLEGPVGAFICDETAYCEALYDETLAVTRLLRPQRFISRQDSGRQAPIADAAGGAGVPRIVINYNSFPSKAPGVANHVQRFLFNVRMPETLSDRFVMWSPHLARLSREVYGPRGLDATQPLRLVPKPMEELVRAPGPYRVLHASNFTEWVGFFPWIMETSLEFIADILALERECNGLEQVELTIRTKPKGEGHPDYLRRLLPDDTRAKVTGTNQPFPEALAEADLMVGFGSTTIEEAMLSRKPVLLWGPTRRYQQLPARSTPPEGEDRAAVYVVHEREQLAPMITAILEAHAGKPLTDAEIADHVWPEGTPTLDDLAQSLATPPLATPPSGADRAAA